MDDTPLMGGEKSNKHHSKECMIPSFIAGVLGVLLLGAIAGIVVLLTLPSDNSCDKPDVSSIGPTPVVFIEYSAEMFTVFCDSYNFHCNVGMKSMMYSFGPGKYCTDQIDDNGTVLVHQYSTHEDKTIVTCQKVGNHGNCLNLSTAINTMAISTAGYEMVDSNKPCTSFFPNLPQLIPNRKLDKCDYYIFPAIDNIGSGGDKIVQMLVESGNNYPVLQAVKNFQSATSQIAVFASFTAKKPEDEEKHLQPFPNVTVYDLRNHEGNFSEKVTFTTKKYVKEHPQVEAMRRANAVREILHLPVYQFAGSLSSSNVRNTAPRKVREIPEDFDSRVHFKSCSNVISAVVDQWTCESCWAMSSAAVLADRFCVANMSKGQLSPQYMVYCGKHSFGCQGNMLALSIWNQLVNEGTVSEECIPYTSRDGACPAECRDGSLITEDMIYRAKDIVVPWAESTEARVEAIQNEIMTNGPVQVSFMMFDDLISYSGGIYHRTKEASFFGAHAVRMVGWGTENGTDFWTVANSWGNIWGEGGFFRIRRGVNECNIESVVVAGLVQ